MSLISNCRSILVLQKAILVVVDSRVASSGFSWIDYWSFDDYRCDSMWSSSRFDWEQSIRLDWRLFHRRECSKLLNKVIEGSFSCLYIDWNVSKDRNEIVERIVSIRRSSTDLIHGKHDVFRMQREILRRFRRFFQCRVLSHILRFHWHFERLMSIHLNQFILLQNQIDLFYQYIKSSKLIEDLCETYVEDVSEWQNPYVVRGIKL